MSKLDDFFLKTKNKLILGYQNHLLVFMIASQNMNSIMISSTHKNAKNQGINKQLRFYLKPWNEENQKPLKTKVYFPENNKYL